jgi:hypothetical protein
LNPHGCSTQGSIGPTGFRAVGGQAAGATEDEILEDSPYFAADDIKVCLDYAALLAWFEPLVDQIVTMVEAGDRLIELR